MADNREAFSGSPVCKWAKKKKVTTCIPGLHVRTMSFCAPSRTGREGTTCFNADELEVLAHAWNDTPAGRQRPIDIPDPLTVTDEDRKSRLHAELLSRFQPFCNSAEYCWLDNKELNASLKQISPGLHRLIHASILKPKGTPGKNDWLSTTEIDNVMIQYEELFPDFKYLGCFPSDYFLIHPEALPVSDISASKRSAIVYNLDSARQPGSHWVAIYFHKNGSDGKLTIEYFDATGRGPNKNLKTFLALPYFANARYAENAFPHQKGDNECGVYSLYFILERLMGRSFEDMSRKRIPDTAMNRFRTFLFRPFSEAFSVDSWHG